MTITPGDWTLRIQGHGVAVESAGLSVAWCGHASHYAAGDVRSNGQKECEANARLIAASPKLLAAVKLALETPSRGLDIEVIDALKAALALTEPKDVPCPSSPSSAKSARTKKKSSASSTRRASTT